MKRFIFKHVTLTRKLRSYHLSAMFSDISEFLCLNWNYYKTRHYKVKELILSGDIALNYSILNGNIYQYQHRMHKLIQGEVYGNLYPVLIPYHQLKVPKGHLTESRGAAG